MSQRERNRWQLVLDAFLRLNRRQQFVLGISLLLIVIAVGVVEWAMSRPATAPMPQVPDSACLNANAICSSPNLDFFMANSLPEITQP